MKITSLQKFLILWKRRLKKYWYAITVLILCILLTGFYLKWYFSLPICDYCGEHSISKLTEISSYKLCDRCWSELDFEAGKIYGNKYCTERIKWISVLVDRRHI